MKVSYVNRGERPFIKIDESKLPEAILRTGYKTQAKVIVVDNVVDNYETTTGGDYNHETQTIRIFPKNHLNHYRQTYLGRLNAGGSLVSNDKIQKVYVPVFKTLNRDSDYIAATKDNLPSSRRFIEYLSAAQDGFAGRMTKEQADQRVKKILPDY